MTLTSIIRSNPDIQFTLSAGEGQIIWVEMSHTALGEEIVRVSAGNDEELALEVSNAVLEFRSRERLRVGGELGRN